MQHRQTQFAPDYFFHLRLSRIQIQVTERTRSYHTISAIVKSILNMFACHLKRLVSGITRQRPAAALRPPSIINRSCPDRPKYIFHRFGLVRVIVKQLILSSQQIAPIKRRALQTRKLRVLVLAPSSHICTIATTEFHSVMP